MARDIWSGDLLNREPDAIFLYNLLKQRNVERNRIPGSGSFVLNVDAKWGQGKSFFLKRMYEMTLQQNHPAVFIDAWKFDFVDDPYSIVVAALDEYLRSFAQPKTTDDSSASSKKEVISKKLHALKKNFGSIAYVVGKEAGKKFIRAGIGEGLEQAVAYLASEDETEPSNRHSEESKSEVDDDGFGSKIVNVVEASLGDLTDAAIDQFAQSKIDDINEAKRSLSLFQTSLSAILDGLEESAGKQLPMFIFVDELDRCKPTYAIAMLERIKHLFDVSNVVFVIATDTSELSHSIRAVYGSEFNSRDYLGRFFQRTYQLPDPTRYQIVLNYLENNRLFSNKWSIAGDDSHHGYTNFITETAGKFDLSIRDLEQSLELLHDVTSAWVAKVPIEISFMYVLICQFIKERQISDGDWSSLTTKIQKFGRSWNVPGFTDTHFSEIVAQMWRLSFMPLQKGFSEFNAAVSNQGTQLNRYFFDLLRREMVERNNTNETTETSPSFSGYIDIIRYARNLRSAL